MKILWIVVVVILALGTACNQDRLARLEKENKELHAEFEKQKQLVDLDTQAKCARAAKQYFREEFQPDSSTILLDHHSHYNKSLGKCFVLIEWHYREEVSKTGSWYNIMKLADAYERDEYGRFSLYTEITFDPTLKSEERIYECEVAGTKCDSIEQFNKLSTQFLNQ